MESPAEFVHSSMRIHWSKQINTVFSVICAKEVQFNDAVRVYLKYNCVCHFFAISAFKKILAVLVCQLQLNIKNSTPGGSP